MPSCDFREKPELCNAIGIDDAVLGDLGNEMTEILPEALNTPTATLHPSEVSVTKQKVIAGQTNDHLWIVIHTGDNPERVKNLGERRVQIENAIAKLDILPSGTRFLVWIIAGAHQTWTDGVITIP